MAEAQSSGIELAAFEPAQVDDLISMWRQAFEHGVGIIDPHPIAEQKQYFVDKVLPGHAVTCALEGTPRGARLVGFVAASPESVSQLHVRVGWHRRGIGTRLLGWAQAQSTGSLWLYTFACNRVARAFYEHHGFIDIAHGFEPEWQLDDVKYLWTRPA